MPAGPAAKRLDVDLPLLGVADHGDVDGIRGRLASDGRERRHAEEDAAGRVGPRLGRHDADAQSRVAAGAETDDRAVELLRGPAELGEKLGQRRGQIAGMATGLVEPAFGANASPSARATTPG